MNFGYLFLLPLQRLLLLLLLVPGWENTMAVKDGEIRRNPKIRGFCCCCCCCCCWSPDGKTPWQWRTEKLQNCTPKMPNVTSETHRKWWFWLLFPLAAALNIGYLFLLLLQRLLLLLWLLLQLPATTTRHLLMDYTRCAAVAAAAAAGLVVRVNFFFSLARSPLASAGVGGYSYYVTMRHNHYQGQEMRPEMSIMLQAHERFVEVATSWISCYGAQILAEPGSFVQPSLPHRHHHFYPSLKDAEGLPKKTFLVVDEVKAPCRHM